MLKKGEKCSEKYSFHIKYFNTIDDDANRPYLVFFCFVFSELKPGTYIYFGLIYIYYRVYTYVHFVLI